MTVEKVISALNLLPENVADGACEIESAYAGDFLSWVMGRALPKSIWFTVMNNINVAGVAALADVALVVLCEGVRADDNLLAKAKMQGINVAVSELPIYETCVAFSKVKGE